MVGRAPEFERKAGGGGGPGLAGETASHSKKKGGQGFTLVEVLVASLLLFLALAGIVPFFLGGLNQASTVRYKSIASNIARERMEQIRQLDYREITENPSEGVTLSERFGTTAEQRGIQFDISYAVESSSYEAGLLKKVTVTVSWTAPPKVSPASLTTMIHQQFLGPRGAFLEVSPTTHDPLGTPFPLLGHEVTVKYHIAQSDWARVYDDLDKPGMHPRRDVYMRLTAWADTAGVSVTLGNENADFKITELHYTTDARGLVDDVWFEYRFDSVKIPDGYWELRATAYNEYGEPGNTWRLRVRVENGPPAPPTNVVATAFANGVVRLTWLGGREIDRQSYIIERYCETSPTPEWDTIADNIGSAETYYEESGVAPTEENPEGVHPWGTAEQANTYRYRIHAVDIAGNEGLSTESNPVTLPTDTPYTEPPAPSGETSEPEPKTYSIKIDNNTNQDWSVKIYDEANRCVWLGICYRDVKGLVVSGLLNGRYQIIATQQNKSREASFSLPETDGTVVLQINNSGKK